MTQDWKSLYQTKQPPSHDSSAEEPDLSLGYSKQAMDHLLNPRNLGRIENWDGLGRFGDPSCGDSLEITIRLDGEDRITDIGFEVHACGGVIATSSMLTELAKGKTPVEAARITDDDVNRTLDGLPESKRHCSVLGVQALRLAILDSMVMRHCLSQGLVKDAQEYREKREQGRIKYDPDQFLKSGEIE